MIRRILAYFLQFVAIASSILLLATLLMIKFDLSEIESLADGFQKFLAINLFAEPLICIFALVALGDMKNRKKEED